MTAFLPILIGLVVLALQGPPATVTLDVTVADDKGQPVPGLDAGSFRVIVDDGPRRVTAVEFVRDDEGLGRTFYLAVDQASFFPGTEQAAAAVAAAVIDRLGPSDRAALVALPEPGLVAGPTADAAVVEAALARLKGRRSPELANFGMGLGEALAIFEGDTFALTGVADRECRGFGNAPPARDSPVAAGTPVIANPRAECVRRLARNVELMLLAARRGSAPVYAALLDLLGAQRERAGEKIVILLTGGLAVTSDDGAFDELAIRAAAARASVHALLVEPQAGTSSLRLLPANPGNDRRGLLRRLDDLAAAARGSAQIAPAGAEGVVDRVMAEASGFYRLTVESHPADAAPRAADRGRTRPLRVEVPGRRATVRVRPFLVAPSRPRTSRTPEERLAEALRGGPVRRDLPMEASGYRLLRGGGEATLLVAGEVGIVQAEAGEPVTVSLSYALFDDQQRPVATGAIPPAGAPRGTPPRLPFLGGLDGVEPGRYLLRVAATDGSGRVGSAERLLDLRGVESGGVALSDVIIGRVEPAGEVIPVPETVSADDRLGFQLDLDGVAGDPPAVQFVIVEPGSASPLLRLPASVQPGETPGARRATAIVRPRLLPAGAYEVRAEVAVGGRRLGPVVRALAVRAAGGVTPAAPAAAAISPALAAQAWTLVPRFSRAAVLGGELFAASLTQLESRLSQPSAKAAVARVRSDGPGAARAAAASDVSDPLGRAFLEGLAFLEAAELEQAAGRFRDAIRAASDFFPAAAYLGACYAAGGRDREAAGAWQTALIDEAAGAPLYPLLVDALLRLRDADAAADLLSEAEARAPNAAALAERRALLEIGRGRPAAALAALDAAPSPGVDVLFLAMNVIADAHAAGQVVESAEADGARMRRYAARYFAANGPERVLVERWLATLK